MVGIDYKKIILLFIFVFIISSAFADYTNFSNQNTIAEDYELKNYCEQATELSTDEIIVGSLDLKLDYFTLNDLKTIKKYAEKTIYTYNKIISDIEKAKSTLREIHELCDAGFLDKITGKATDRLLEKKEEYERQILQIRKEIIAYKYLQITTYTLLYNFIEDNNIKESTYEELVKNYNTFMQGFNSEKAHIFKKEKGQDFKINENEQVNLEYSFYDNYFKDLNYTSLYSLITVNMNYNLDHITKLKLSGETAKDAYFIFLRAANPVEASFNFTKYIFKNAKTIIGILGALGMSKELALGIGVIAPGALGVFLISSFGLSNYTFFNYTVYDKELWTKVEQSKNMILNFENIFNDLEESKNPLYISLNNFNTTFKDIIEINESKEKEIYKRLEADEKKIKEMYKSYQQYAIILKDNETKNKLQLTKNKIIDIKHDFENAKVLKNFILKNKIYSDILKTLDEIEDSFPILEATFSEDTILAYCNSQIAVIPKKSQSQYIQNAIEQYNKTGKDTKLYFCKLILTSVFEDSKYKCTDALKNMADNLGFAYPVNETDKCAQIVDDKINQFKNSDQYHELTLNYEKLKEYVNVIEKALSNSPCSSNKYNNLLNFIGKIEKLSNSFSQDPIAALITHEDAYNIENEIKSKTVEAKKEASNVLGCYFATNYEINAKEKTIEFLNIFGDKDIAFNSVLPIAENVNKVDTKNCLKSVNLKDKYAEFNFSGTCADMKYNLYLNNKISTVKLKSIIVTPYESSLTEEVCFLATNSVEVKVPLPVEYKFIKDVIVSKNLSTLPSFLTEKELTIQDYEVNRKKTCYDVKYILDYPLTINKKITSQKIGTKISYTYNIEIKNNLNIDIDNALILLQNIHKITNKNITAIDESYKKIPITVENETFRFNIKINANAIKNLSFTILTTDDDSLFLQKLQEARLLLAKVKGHNSEKTALSKKLDELEKSNEELNIKFEKLDKIIEEIQKLLKGNYLLERYNRLYNYLENVKEKAPELTTNLNTWFGNYKRIYFKTTEIETILKEAEQLKDKDLRKAIKIMEDYIAKDTFTKQMRQLMSILSNTVKDLLKKAKLYNIDYKSYQNEFTIINDQINEGFKENDYDLLYNSFNKYYKTLESLKSEIAKIESNLKEISKIIAERYANAKKELPSLWDKYNYLLDTINSKAYNALLEAGIKLSVNKSKLKETKRDLDYLNTKTIKLNIYYQEYISKHKDKLENIEEFKKFLSKFDDVNKNINKYFKELKDTSEQYFAKIAQELKNNPNEEIYKAKKLLDKNKYIEAMYYTYLAQKNKPSDFDYTWIILAVAGFAILFVFLRNKDAILKPKKKIKKRTIYRVERGED